MKHMLLALALIATFSQAVGSVEQSILPLMDYIYSHDFGKKVNHQQKASMRYAAQNQSEKVRVMTYNMLYNAKEAEDKLPAQHRWESRQLRLLEYLAFAKADIIGSQELQEDQVQGLMNVIGTDYAYYGEKTRASEGRSDTNAIFFNKSRIDLIESRTIPYSDDNFENAFTYCRFRDKTTDRTFVVINTKLTWGDAERRLEEAIQLNQFSTLTPVEEPIIVMGDFNTFPFTEHKCNIFYDGDHIERVLSGENLKDAKINTVFGHFGPICSITNSRTTFEPFVGPEFPGFILDHIFVNDRVDVFTHGIDTVKVNGEYPSDHFPVIADLFFKP